MQKLFMEVHLIGGTIVAAKLPDSGVIRCWWVAAAGA